MFYDNEKQLRPESEYGVWADKFKGQIQIPQEIIDEFDKLMDELHWPYPPYDGVHEDMDAVIVDLLVGLGFTKGAKIYMEQPKWYA